MSDPALGAGRRSFSRPSGTTRSAFGIAFGAVAHPDAESDEARMPVLAAIFNVCVDGHVCGNGAIRHRESSCCVVCRNLTEG
jgi:hypothetical protein